MLALSKICIFVYLYSLKVPIVEAVLVELDHQQLGRDGAEDEVGIFDLLWESCKKAKNLLL